MNFGKKAMRSVAFAFAIFAVPMIVAPQANVAFADSAVKIVVNKTPITSDDIARRVAFLKLQRQSGNLNEKAREQLIEEALKREEIARVKASVSTADVDAAFGRFAASNKLTKDQLTKVLTQAGVGADHFKSFIAVQMSWPRLVNARYGGKNRMSTQDFITRLKERGQKPVTSEYFLQQIIFVVPESKKSIIGKRKSEAEASASAIPAASRQRPSQPRCWMFRSRTLAGFSNRNFPRSGRTWLPRRLRAAHRHARDREGRRVPGCLQEAAGFR